MATPQTIARDLSLVLGELRDLQKSGQLDPLVASMLKVMIRLVEMLRRQALSMR